MNTETMQHDEVLISTDQLIAARICNACGSKGTNRYCGQCGNPLAPPRITFKGIVHDVFHFFTHLDKGFLFTLKCLVAQPGTMQRRYVDGERSRHQKPFSMFFICLSIAAIGRYWIAKTVSAGGDIEGDGEILFFDKYMVFFHFALLPVNALITYLFFLRSKYNYAEIAVLSLYSVSFFLLLSVLVSTLKFISPHIDTAFIELPFILIYNVISLMHFFNDGNRFTVFFKSLAVTICLFIMVQLTEDLFVKMII